LAPRENEDLKVLVGQTLVRLRRDVGLTQEKLAEIAGLERGYVSLIERGLRMPTVDTVFRFCRGLKSTPSELIRDVELLACRIKRGTPDPNTKGREF
jgi:transcriptional regulator with XRE-family HTH domain